MLRMIGHSGFGTYLSCFQDPHVDNRNFYLHYGDMTDSTNLIRLIQEIQPDEIYNLAAMSHVAVSFEIPEYTGNADGLGALRILDAIRLLKLPAINFLLRSYRFILNLNLK